jgi:triphosphatase
LEADNLLLYIVATNSCRSAKRVWCGSMRSVAGEELELKLELTQQEIEQIGSHPALEPLTVGRPETHTLRSIYFDTPDHQLRAHGISLRLRSSDEDRWVQTVKLGDGEINGVSHRKQLETPMAIPEPDLEAITDRKVRRKIEHAVRTAPLEPLFETVVKRTTRKLHSDKGDLELALDEGVVRAGKEEAKLCEAELELKSGSPVSLLEMASTLFASAPFRLAHTTKADRGYNLILGRQDESVVPRRAVQPTLRADEACSEALSLFVESASNQIIANRRVVLESDDPEGAHQLRIGLRRLRSALRAFRPLDDTPALRELEEHAQDLARSVGRLRDADVLLADIFAQVASQMKGEAGFAELRQGLVAHRFKVRDEVRQALSGTQWSKLQLYLVLWPRTIGENVSLQIPVRDFATPVLRKTWKKVAKLGAAIDGLSFEERHEMRIALKTFRYMVEFFGSLYAKGKIKRFVKDLQELQEMFGYINDVLRAKELNAIAHEYCASDQAAQRAAGYVLGWHDAEATHRWAAAPKEWRRLKERSRFWAK